MKHQTSTINIDTYTLYTCWQQFRKLAESFTFADVFFDTAVNVNVFRITAMRLPSNKYT